MVRDGSLPAVRRDGCWHVAAADLLSLSGTRSTRGAISITKPRPSVERPAEPCSPSVDVLLPSPAAVQGPAKRQDREAAGGVGAGTATAARPILQVKGAGKLVPGAAQPPADAPRPELIAVLDMLAQRDAQIAALQDERARLYAQLGLLQGVLAERDGRLRPLKAQRVAKPYREDGSATTTLAEPAHVLKGPPQGLPGIAQAPTGTMQERTGAGALAHPPDSEIHGPSAVGRKPGNTLVGAATMPVAVQRRLVHSLRRLLGPRN